MRTKSKLLALALAAALQPATAAVVTVDFENPDTWGELLRTQIPGLSFSGDAWSVGSTRCGGDINWIRPDSCGALELAVNPWGDEDLTAPKSFTINFAGGFVEEFKFAFSLLDTTSAKIQIFEGLNGTGRELGNAESLLRLTSCPPGDFRFCVWDLDNAIKFEGTALSVKVSGVDQNMLLDNLSFITPTATGRLPEPGSVGLALSAIGALAWVRRRSAR